MLKKLIVSIILAIVALFFVGYVTPELEAIVTTGITNTFVTTMIGLAIWVVPVGAIVGVILSIFVMFRAKQAD